MDGGTESVDCLARKTVSYLPLMIFIALVAIAAMVVMTLEANPARPN